MSNKYELMKADAAFRGEISSFDDNDLVSMKGRGLPKGLNKGKGMTKPKPTPRQFKIIITNGNATDERFFLLPSDLIDEDEKGHPLSGKAISGNTLTYAGVVGDSLKRFYRFIGKNPMLANELRVQTNKPDDQYTGDNNINISRYNDPFEAATAADPILVSEYQDPSDNNNKIIRGIPFNVSMDSQTQAEYVVAANSKLTITINCGIIVNTGDAVQRAANQNA